MRRKQLNWLIGLSSISAVALYVIQGALATGADVSAFPPWFWVLDNVLWGCRALIEAAVIVYLFSTEAETNAQKRALAVFEFALIALITLTVGPALRAVGLGLRISDSLAPAAYTAWTYGIAAYTSLMVGAAGYAFRVQPDEAGEGDYEALSRDNADLMREVDGYKLKVAHKESEIEHLETAVEAWALLNKTDRAALIAQCANGDRPSVADAAAALDASPSTVRRAWEGVE